MAEGERTDKRRELLVMNEGAPGAPAGRTWRWWPALRLALVLLWLLAAGMTWWTAPRQQGYDQARADAAAGRITAYQWGDRWDVSTPPRWFDTPALHSSDTLGPLFAWRTPDGRRHWTDTDRFDQVTITDTVDNGSYSGPGAIGVAQDLRASGLEHRAGALHLPTPVVIWAGLVLAVISVGVVVAGPAPVRGTRWFWFWLISITPYGLGLLYWWAREHPWSASATPAGHVDRRDSGILGLGLGILASIVISLVLLALHTALGDRWVPQPGT
ncbi:hypothetical protein GCM10009541_03240 [Micromonospora gifhornensis]|uniref:PepSY-associated TM region n=2 Tax=Micromonospora gifhornensis TaxID=84594 RepID=A0ABQ4IC05_9ACTN|nr:hypothetical protein Vgi01_21280 [Micromonospora gifhornensis]